MGGGGAMRAAAKAASLGLQNAGVRGGLPENFASARNAFRQSASVDDTTSRIEFTAVSPTAQPLNWELDDCEFDGYGLEEQPKLVFEPAPTLEETKEATSELRDALDNVTPEIGSLANASHYPWEPDHRRTRSQASPA